MLEVKLVGISPDGEGHVAYLQILDDTGKVLDNRTVGYETETKFNNAVKKLLAEFKVKHQPKEDIKSKVQKKLDAINLLEKTL
jgi:hypothetical protein